VACFALSSGYIIHPRAIGGKECCRFYQRGHGPPYIPGMYPGQVPVEAVIEASDITNKEQIVDQLIPSIQVDKNTGMQVNKLNKLPTPEGFVNVLED